MERVMSDGFYSARVTLYSDETRACRTLLMLMKTLATNEQKQTQEREMRNTRRVYE